MSLVSSIFRLVSSLSLVSQLHVLSLRRKRQSTNFPSHFPFIYLNDETPIALQVPDNDDPFISQDDILDFNTREIDASIFSNEPIPPQDFMEYFENEAVINPDENPDHIIVQIPATTPIAVPDFDDSPPPQPDIVYSQLISQLHNVIHSFQSHVADYEYETAVIGGSTSPLFEFGIRQVENLQMHDFEDIDQANVWTVLEGMQSEISQFQDLLQYEAAMLDSEIALLRAREELANAREFLNSRQHEDVGGTASVIEVIPLSDAVGSAGITPAGTYTFTDHAHSSVQMLHSQETGELRRFRPGRFLTDEEMEDEDRQMVRYFGHERCLDTNWWSSVSSEEEDEEICCDSTPASSANSSSSGSISVADAGREMVDLRSQSNEHDAAEESGSNISIVHL